MRIYGNCAFSVRLADMQSVRIKAGRESIFLKHNSRVYSGAIIEDTSLEDASIVNVTTADGSFIAWGWWDSRSFTKLHLLSWDEDIIPDDSWLRARIREASSLRKHILSEDTTACRLIHGEADFIPGLAADIYSDEIRIILSNRYALSHLAVIVSSLFECTPASLISVSVDRTHAQLEGMRQTVRHFTRAGEISAPEGKNTCFRESGLWFEIEKGISQKSGFYCDQRNNRNIIEKYAAGKTVLDVCSFTGAFTLHALRAGCASVLAVDSSESVLRHLLYQVHLNENRGSLPAGSREKVSILKRDAFTLLREIEDDRYDMIILDPPKLAPKKSREKEALAGYKDLNLLAMKKIRSGGILATFSCSGALSRQDFTTAVSYAAADLGVDVQVLDFLSAGADHPVRLSLPETEYLKGLVLRVVK